MNISICVVCDDYDCETGCIMIEVCEDCMGTGRIVGVLCPYCSGMGVQDA